jgi:serine/threonine-protein kinase HipA
LAGRAVGTLAQTDEGAIYFEYDPDWLGGGFSISPYHLPLSPGLKRAKPDPFDGLFGVFDDSLPDGWGRLLTDRFFRARGIAPEELTPLDRLAHIGRRAMGALEYHPPADPEEPGALPLDLFTVAQEAEGIVAGSPKEALPELRAAGRSASGARPKVFVTVDPAHQRMSSDLTGAAPGLEHWLIKFRAREDPPDAGAVEQAYAALARSAGITVPVTRLFRTEAGNFFGAQRFDWLAGGTRVHTHSFGGLVHSDFRHPNRDYTELLAVVFDLTRDHRQVEQAFRRAAFNVMACNRDDHVKNFAFQHLPGSGWRLSPAYDLTFSSGVNGQHNLTVAGQGDPGVGDLRALAADAGIDRAGAERMLRDVREAVGTWAVVAEENGVSPATLRTIQGSIERGS